MAQRDYEVQPESPDLGAAVQLETAESLVGPPDTDAVDAGYSPPDRPYALDDDELTVAGQRDGETLDERLAREVPEEVPVDVDRAGRLADPEQLGLMERGDAIEGQDVGVDGGAASAEEAAVHVVDLGTDPDALADEEGGQAAVDDEIVAETLAADPTVDAARVDAARDLRATDEGSASRWTTRRRARLTPPPGPRGRRGVQQSHFPAVPPRKATSASRAAVERRMSRRPSGPPGPAAVALVRAGRRAPAALPRLGAARHHGARAGGGARSSGPWCRPRRSGGRRAADPRLDRRSA